MNFYSKNTSFLPNVFSGRVRTADNELWRAHYQGDYIVAKPWLDFSPSKHNSLVDVIRLDRPSFFYQPGPDYLLYGSQFVVFEFSYFGKTGNDSKNIGVCFDFKSSPKFYNYNHLKFTDIYALGYLKKKYSLDFEYFPALSRLKNLKSAIYYCRIFSLYQLFRTAFFTCTALQLFFGANLMIRDSIVLGASSLSAYHLKRKFWAWFPYVTRKKALIMGFKFFCKSALFSASYGLLKRANFFRFGFYYSKSCGFNNNFFNVFICFQCLNFREKDYNRVLFVHLILTRSNLLPLTATQRGMLLGRFKGNLATDSRYSYLFKNFLLVSHNIGV